jgi:hypothetical protein
MTAWAERGVGQSMASMSRVDAVEQTLQPEEEACFPGRRCSRLFPVTGQRFTPRVSSAIVRPRRCARRQLIGCASSRW